MTFGYFTDLFCSDQNTKQVLNKKEIVIVQAGTGILIVSSIALLAAAVTAILVPTMPLIVIFICLACVAVGLITHVVPKIVANGRREMAENTEENNESIVGGRTPNAETKLNGMNNSVESNLNDDLTPGNPVTPHVELQSKEADNSAKSDSITIEWSGGENQNTGIDELKFAGYKGACFPGRGWINTGIILISSKGTRITLTIDKLDKDKLPKIQVKCLTWSINRSVEVRFDSLNNVPFSEYSEIFDGIFQPEVLLLNYMVEGNDVLSGMCNHKWEKLRAVSIESHYTGMDKFEKNLCDLMKSNCGVCVFPGYDMRGDQRWYTETLKKTMDETGGKLMCICADQEEQEKILANGNWKAEAFEIIDMSLDMNADFDENKKPKAEAKFKKPTS
ncbi:MAG: hypothetical protein LBI69_05025 [Puniceicoccales bacterium]|jgi:hypothetical protein|nr:hypothetical protein [Puniceicoccales bacterium]